MTMIETIENALSQKAAKIFLPIQPGKVQTAYADIRSLTYAVGFDPKISIGLGIEKFVEWYQRFELAADLL